jgi:hypothetical protein
MHAAADQGLAASRERPGISLHSEERERERRRLASAPHYYRLTVKFAKVEVRKRECMSTRD